MKALRQMPAPYVAAAGFLLSLVHLFRQLSCATPEMLGVWLNSDTLWPVHVFTDVLRDHYSLSTWVFSIAPYWFPDLTVVGIFWLLTRNVILATLFAGFIQIALLLAAFHLCRRALDVGASFLQNTFLLTTAVAVALYVAARPGRTYPAIYQLFLTETHVGNLVMVLCGLGLGLLWIRRSLEATPIGRGVVIAYALTSFLGGMSNLMFFVHFLLPFSVALWFAEFLRILKWRQCGRPILIGWISAFAGVATSRVLLHSAAISTQAGISASRISTSIGVFVQGAVEKALTADGLHLIAIAWFMVCAAFTLYGLRGVDRMEKSAAQQRRLTWIFFVVCLLSSVFGFAAVVLGGSNTLVEFKDYAYTMHYWHPAFLLPIFGFPLLLSWRMAATCTEKVQRGAAWAAAVLGVVLPAYAIASGASPAVHLASYRPPLVRFMDDLAAREKLHYGYAGYWQARLTTLLSAQGVRAYAVDGMLNPLLWASNREWYGESLEDRKKPPKIDFVILDDPLWKITREAAVRALGEPSQEVRFADTRILIYANAPHPEQPLTSFRQVLTSPSTRLALHPGQEIRVPVHIQNPGTDTWVASGKYPITVSYKWYDHGRLLPIEGERTGLPGAIAPGGGADVNVRVVGADKAGRYALRITLVEEGVAWFMTKSNMYLELPVTVN